MSDTARNRDSAPVDPAHAQTPPTAPPETPPAPTDPAAGNRSQVSDTPSSPTPPAGSASTEPALASAAAMKYIGDQLAEERATKSALEDRANTVITSAGALTTLLFALSALATKAAATYELPGFAKVLLVVATCFFLVAIVFALRTAAPAAYAEVTVESLRKVATPEAFSASAAEAEPIIAKAMVEVIAGARSGNGQKARDLKRAVQAELAAAIVVAIAVIVVLTA
jgi:hypothetical protein